MIRLLRRVGDRGAFAVELAVLAPVLLLLFTMIWEAGQVVHAQHQVQSAAEDLARTATAQNISSTSGQIPADLDGYRCNQPDVQPNPVTNTDPDQPQVTEYDVTITCNVSLIGGFTKTVTAQAVSYDDPYRSTPGTTP